MSKTYYRTRGEFEESWQVLHVDDARRQGYIPYFGPCTIHGEGEQIQNAINDILRNGRDKYCIVKFPGSMVEVWIIPNHNQGHPCPYVFTINDPGEREIIETLIALIEEEEDIADRDNKPMGSLLNPETIKRHPSLLRDLEDPK